MPTPFTFMSANIKQFSLTRAQSIVPIRSQFMGDIEMQALYAKMMCLHEVDVFSIMEVTVGDGKSAVELLTDRINKESRANAFDCVVTPRNISATSKVARRADCYGLIYNKKKFRIEDFQLTFDDPNLKDIRFPDRCPVVVKVVPLSTPTKAFYVSTWHAPQPKYHLQATTMQPMVETLSRLKKLTPHGCIFSGDLNYDTSHAPTYKALTDAKFTGLFNGQQTTLRRNLATRMKHPQGGEKFIKVDEIEDYTLKNPFDNIFLHGFKPQDQAVVCLPTWMASVDGVDISKATVPKTQLQHTLWLANQMSDHCPVITKVNHSGTFEELWMIATY